MSRTIRTLTRDQIGTLLDWAAAEGWNPGLADARAFQAADPNGFLGAFVGDVMVAAIAAVAYNEAFGFIGLYICHPHWRGQGHGKVWDAGIAYLGERTIGLDAVPEQRGNYASMGFVPAYETIRMSGRVDGSLAGADRHKPQLADILSLDRLGFPASRHAFLQHWLASPHHAFMRRAAGKIEAYGVLRPCKDGAKLGPLFARTQDAALAILADTAGPLHVDVPAFQTEFLLTISTLGFTPGFRTTRMYRGPAPALSSPTIYGVTTLELG